MSTREKYALGAALHAEARKDNDTNWTLVLVREFRHPPDKVWDAITDPAQLREWAPFDASASLGSAGSTVKLTTIGAPQPHVTETRVTRADKPQLLEYTWGGNNMRWQLEAAGAGTRLTLWASIDKRFIAMGAAGWHVCLDVLDRLLADEPIGRIAGPAAMQVEGWQRLLGEYAKQLKAELPSWG
jgi:uncharacterized protein YndB with AHSA1/START domain